jgi:hypothetical protein
MIAAEPAEKSLALWEPLEIRFPIALAANMAQAVTDFHKMQKASIVVRELFEEIIIVRELEE